MGLSDRPANRLTTIPSTGHRVAVRVASWWPCVVEFNWGDDEIMAVDWQLSFGNSWKFREGTRSNATWARCELTCLWSNWYADTCGFPPLVWTISIHPKGDTYASTGGDGGVSIHSASPVDFGSRRQHFPLSGRKKPFGMALKHVSGLYRCLLLAFLIFCRALMDQKLLWPQKQAKSTCSILSQLNFWTLIPLMRCVYAQ